MEVLKRRVGPVPVWVLAVGGGVAVWWFFLRGDGGSSGGIMDRVGAAPADPNLQVVYQSSGGVTLSGSKTFYLGIHSHYHHHVKWGHKGQMNHPHGPRHHGLNQEP